MQAQVHGHLLKAAARQERCNGVDVRDEPVHGETGRHPDDAGFGHPLHEEAVRHLLAKGVERPCPEVGADEHHALVLFGKLIDHVEAGTAHG